MLYVLGDYTLDLECYELRQAGALVKLEPRVFDLLSYLVQHPGRTVTKEELYAQVWPNQSIVSDNSLTKCVEQARKAIGDTGQGQRCIQTVRSRGYRFIAPIEIRQRPETDATSPPAADPPIPAEQHGLDQADAGSSPAPGQIEQPSAPPPMQVTVSRPRSAGHAMPDAERRQLTVLVCRLVGGPALAKPLDPEDLFEVARDYHDTCAEVVRQYEGYMAQSQGDRLVVYFGYPRAHEDDARRAVHTGLRLVEGMDRLNRCLRRDRGVQLAVRVGIHTGIMVVRAREHNDAPEPFTLGDTPTIATELQSLAVPDTVVISSTTFRLVEGYFACWALGNHILDNPAESLAVYHVLQESAAQSRFDIAVTNGLIPLVGREQEVGLLLERWAKVKDGTGQVVWLSGEAGIGKSRLAQVLREHLTGEAHTPIECRCSPYYQNSALYPVISHLQLLLQFRRDDTPQEKLHKLEEILKPHGFALEEVVPLLAALLSLPLSERYPPLTLTPQRQKQKTLEVLLEWLLKEAERQPVCLVVEDLHWVDASTLEFLGLLVDQAPLARLLVLLIFRPDFRPPWAIRSHLTHLTLSRLTRHQVETMVERITEGKALPGEVLQQLITKTDGVPLFVEEATKMVLESGLVKEWEGRYALTGPLPPLAIPATLHDSLMARLDRLETAKEVVQLGATIGREFTYEVIRLVSPVEEATLQHALTRLVEAELLYQRGLPPQARYLFRHALIQDAAYVSLLRSTRQQYHRQIAQVLEATFPETCETHPELLAHHYTEAGLHAQALPYWQRAGQRAIERSANVEAIDHLTKGLEGLKTLPETPECTQYELTLQLALGAALSMLKGYTAPEMEQAYSRARELCQQVGDSPQRFAALTGLKRFYRSRTELKTAQELGEQLLKLAHSIQDRAFLSSAFCEQGMTLWHLGEFTAALAHLEEGIAYCDPQKHHPHALSYWHPAVLCLSYAARALWFLGYPDQALSKSHEALALARQLSQPYLLASALHLAASLHVWRREAQLVQERAEATIVLSREHEFIRWLVGGIIRRGWALAELGLVEEGIEQLRQGIATWWEMGTKQGELQHLAMLTEAYKHGGQTEEGLHVLANALTSVHTNEERYYEAELYRLQGELLLEEGERFGEAEESFLRALGVARHQSAKSLELRAVMSLCRLQQKQGKSVEIRQLLMEIYSWFQEGFSTPDLQEAKLLLEA